MRMRAGVALLAVSLLAAACSASNSPSGNGASAPPRGLAGTPGSASLSAPGSAGASGSTTPGRHRSASRTASASATATATGGQHSTTPATHRSTSSVPRTSAPHTSTSTKPRPPSGPTVTVTPHTGLSNGQTVTVEGWHFKPHTNLAIAECRDRGVDTNLSDCNINNVVTYAPGKKVTSDANGHVGPVQIRVNKTFKQVNCATVACLVAISEPALNPDPADEGDEYIHFV